MTPSCARRRYPVTTFDKELRRLVKDLTDTMRDAPGSGLAAPQIGVSLRVFTYDIDDEIGHLINPVLGPFSEEMMDGDEGCLSIPDLAFELKRPERVVAVGQNMYGDPVTIEGHGLPLPRAAARDRPPRRDPVRRPARRRRRGRPR